MLVADFLDPPSIKGRVSKAATRAGIVCFAADHPGQINDIIAARWAHCERKKIPRTPFLIATGPSRNDVQSFVLAVDIDYSYQIAQFREALVTLFGSLWTFFTPYFQESFHVWQVLLDQLFNVTADKTSTVTVLINELRVDPAVDW